MNPYLRKLNIFYMFLLSFSLIVPMVFTGLSFAFEEDEPIIKLDKLMIYILIFVCLVDLFMSQFIYKLQTQKNHDSKSIKEKARTYQSAKVIQATIMLFAANLSGLFLFISGEKLFLVVFPLVWFLFVKNKTSVNQMIEDFQLTPNEKQAIFDRNFDIQ